MISSHENCQQAKEERVVLIYYIHRGNRRRSRERGRKERKNLSLRKTNYRSRPLLFDATPIAIKSGDEGISEGKGGIGAKTGRPACAISRTQCSLMVPRGEMCVGDVLTCVENLYSSPSRNNKPWQWVRPPSPLSRTHHIQTPKPSSPLAFPSGYK